MRGKHGENHGKTQEFMTVDGELIFILKMENLEDNWGMIFEYSN